LNAAGGGGGTGQQYAATTTPQASGGSTATPQPQTKVATTTPASADATETPVQMASVTTPGSQQSGYDYSQFAMEDIPPPPQDMAQQDDGPQKLPGWETPQLTGAAQDTNAHPFIDTPPTQTGIDEAMAGRLAAGKQRMAGLGDTSSMANLFANAYEANQNIGQAGRSQEELAQMLAAKNKNGDRNGGIEGFA
jgi:hypothetical protein